METYYTCLICITKGDWDSSYVVCCKCRFFHTIEHQHYMKKYYLKKSEHTCIYCNDDVNANVNDGNICNIYPTKKIIQSKK